MASLGARRDARRRADLPRPGHGTAPEVGRQFEPIGPGSRELKVKDGGGTAGEAPVALAIARRTRALLVERGFRGL